MMLHQAIFPVSDSFTCKLPFLQILTNMNFKITKKELDQMKEQCLIQAESRNQRNKNNIYIKNWESDFLFRAQKWWGYVGLISRFHNCLCT